MRTTPIDSGPSKERGCAARYVSSTWRADRLVRGARGLAIGTTDARRRRD
jgi:hypothetical protein